MNPDQSPLGKPVDYLEHYDAALLFPIERARGREPLGLTGALPFFGSDIWNAYELSWLNPRGKPQIALATLAVRPIRPISSSRNR